ncbi:MAG: zinc dependent phospholipase C family protein [Candidatus Hadarchaeota archaeon]
MRGACLAFCVLLLLATARGAQAWNGKTHQDIAEAAHQKLPDNLRLLLSYTTVQEGAVWPDRYRTTPDPSGRTFPSSGHIQPASRAQADNWLKQAENRYLENDLENAALYLGIAAHLISDSVTLVHNIDWTNLHEVYEAQGEQFYPAEPWGIAGFNLEQKLAEYYNGASAKWQSWQSTRDPNIVSEGVDLAASYTYNSWSQALGISPQMQPEQLNQPINLGLAATAAIVILVVAAAAFYRHYRHGKSSGYSSVPLQPQPP